MTEDTKPLTTDTVIWQNRLVKMLDETTWAMSAVGNHEDWDFCPDIPSENMAVAGGMSVFDDNGQMSPPAKITRIIAADPNCLLFMDTEKSFWLLTGNPAKDGRIERYSPSP